MAGVYLRDPDVTILHGDVLEQLATLPDGSVDCCVTSPPYWGLRDYGTGAWDGGDPDCDHLPRAQVSVIDGAAARLRDKPSQSCKCGATRVDHQLGLEPTPDEYVTNMVAVFREVRRVLKDCGTLWLNLGDSYASSPKGNPDALSDGLTNGGRAQREANAHRTRSTVVAGLKSKDLVGIPWRVAFALQADGWYLRSDIIWAKPNPMPESVTDRPTKAHEYVFLLSKQPRYFFDQEAVREAHTSSRWGGPIAQNTEDWKYRNGGDLVGTRERDDREFYPNGGRNVRSVWDIATQPYPEAHFATYPEELVRRCILAGTSERGVCPVCGKPWERETSVEYDWYREKKERQFSGNSTYVSTSSKDHLTGETKPREAGLARKVVETLGWRPSCAHDQPPIPATVLDPFLGSGTTAHVARKHGRRAVGVELNADYCELAAKRLAQQSLLALEGDA